MTRLFLLVAALFTAGPVSAAEPIPVVADKVNQKLVKLFGAGGFRSVTNYGTGILISADGYILTVASQLLDTTDIVVHLYDGRRMKASVVVVEPELDCAIVKIHAEGKKPDEPTGLDLPHFDLIAAAKQPPAKPDDWVLAFSNCFDIAERDEAMTVQRGVIAAHTKLQGRRGIFDFPFHGDVYVVDAITNNPGAGGGALTDRSGRLLGIVGREIKNRLSDTWMNYAIPVNGSVTIKDGDKEVTLSIPEFVAKGMAGAYKPVKRTEAANGPGGYHGIRFVPNVIERTPPYVEDVFPGTPAEKAGLRTNDLISFVDGEPIVSIKAFNEYIKKTKPGDTIRLEVRRGDNLTTIDLKLENYPPKKAPPKTETSPDPVKK
ncbi:MAG TPA: trypsin-like peptidase domain-containing protein [Fimbriiglobus sp.]|jgi:serine protease Do